MGNFSRKPEDRLKDALAKHYVGVRLQQGVPLLDADWNEMDGIRRVEHETLGAWFIGDGVPAGSDGFRIVDNNQDNNFLIRKGLLLVKGKSVENDRDCNYSDQPHFNDAKIANPPTALKEFPADKQCIVYLDVWDREVDSSDDKTLIDDRIGIETAVRLKREWAVRVANMPEDAAVLASPPAGHVFYSVARLNRKANEKKIKSDMIVDLRSTQLSVQRRIDVRNSNGVTVVDNDRMMQLIENTRKNVLSFITYITTKFNPPTTQLMSVEILGLQAADCISRAAETAIQLMGCETVANRGATGILYQLYYAEDRFHVIWRDIVLHLGGTPKKYAAYQDFVKRLDDRLHQPTVGVLKGLLPALQAGDIEAAVKMQEELTRLIGTASSAVPRGTIQVYLAKTPAGNLLAGQVARFEFSVRSFTTVADTFTVKVMPDSGWPRMVVDNSGNPVPGNRVPIGASGSETTIFVDVTVQTGSSDLQLRVTSDANPNEIDQLTGLFKLSENAPAPVGEDKVQLHISTVSNGKHDANTGIVSIKRNVLGLIELRLFNNAGQNATFDLSLEKTNEVGVWTAEFSGSPSLPVNSGASLPKVVKVTPKDDAVSLELIVKATTTISGSTVKGEIIIPLKATA